MLNIKHQQPAVLGLAWELGQVLCPNSLSHILHVRLGHFYHTVGTSFTVRGAVAQLSESVLYEQWLCHRGLSLLQRRCRVAAVGLTGAVQLSWGVAKWCHQEGTAKVQLGCCQRASAPIIICMLTPSIDSSINYYYIAGLAL